jgi:hypothetical protein
MWHMNSGVRVVCLLLGLGVVACPLGVDLQSDRAGSRSSSGRAGGGPGADLLAGDDCDPLVPTVCAFPFPSNVYLEDDPSTVTGKRVRFGEKSLPMHEGSGDHVSPALFRDMDGFSTGQALLAHLPGATITGLPTQDSISISLSKQSPTVLIEADSGEPVPHFAELDATATTDDDRSFMIRPVVRLKDATRYIVAIRNVIDADGKPLAPSDAFRALRDRESHTHASIDARRSLYDDIFDRLRGAGYSTDDLQLAWDYTTASRENNTSWMLHMRDDALAKVGAIGPEYEVKSIEEDPNPDIKRRIVVDMTVPLYLDKRGPGGVLVFGEDGLPKQNGTAKYEVLIHVPHAATKGTPGHPLQNGHGLLGTKKEGQNGYLATIANRHNYVAFSVDMIGMADGDYPVIVDGIVKDFAIFKDAIIGRQHQGMINSLLAMRMMLGRFVDDPNIQFGGKSAIDPSEGFYRGDSQGGIFGGTYMAITTDVRRGMLGEPGMPYNLLLNRSVDFNPFFVIMMTQFETGRDIQLVLGLVQMMWDRTEPNGYVPYITNNTLPNTPSHNVLIHVAIGDQQVSPLGAHIMMRAMGGKNVSPVNREIWGIPSVAGPFSGNAMVEFSFGLPEVPKTNTPPIAPEEDDPHDKVRVLDASIDQTHKFFQEGVVVSYCDGPCDPE